MRERNQDAFVLQRLIESSLGVEDGEAITNKLLANFGSAEKAIGQFDFKHSNALAINSRLVDIFFSIRELNLSVLYRKISEETNTNCVKRIVEYFCAQFPTRTVYTIQFFFFCGDAFVGCSQPAKGSIDDVAILNRTIFGDALQRNASRILPVVGLPDGIERTADHMKWKLDLFRESSKALEISTEVEVVI